MKQQISNSILKKYLMECSPVLDKLKDWRLVGGCVRDSFLGVETNDIDVVTFMTPKEIKNNLKDFHTNLIGERFGTIGVFFKQWKIEITTARSDFNTDGRHASVLFMKDFEEDSKRRDFTINSLMYDGYLYDYHNGLKDLYDGIVRFIGNPIERIQEDYLRILRYVRFYLRFKKNIKSNELLYDYINIIKNEAHGLKVISIERICNELLLICQIDHEQLAVNLMNEMNIGITVFQTVFYKKNKLYTHINDLRYKEEKLAHMLKKHKLKYICVPKITKLLIESWQQV